MFIFMLCVVSLYFVIATCWVWVVNRCLRRVVVCPVYVSGPLQDSKLNTSNVTRNSMTDITVVNKRLDNLLICWCSSYVSLYIFMYFSSFLWLLHVWFLKYRLMWCWFCFSCSKWRPFGTTPLSLFPGHASEDALATLSSISMV